MAETKNRISSLGAIGTFLKVGTCSETIFNVVDRGFDEPLELEEHGAAPFAGGIIQYGYQCGLLWGATLAAGARSYRLLGAGPKAQTLAVIVAQRLVESFRDRGCLSMENGEAAVLFAVCRSFGVLGGAIFQPYIDLAEGWNPGRLDDAYQVICRLQADVVLDAALRLHEKKAI